MAKNAKVAKSPQIRLQGVSDGSRSQTAWARTTRGTYALAPYAFAALGQGPKGPELVDYIHRIYILGCDVLFTLKKNIQKNGISILFVHFNSFI